MEKNAKKRLFIIDGSSVMYRAFHAVPSSFSNSKGLPTNAIYGFTQSLKKILFDFNPEYAVVAFDVKGPSFRHEILSTYKSERPPMPDLLSVQVPYIKNVIRAFNVPVLEMPAFEADDVIATLVRSVEAEGLKVAVITGDKDMYQLVDENVVILDYLTEKEYGPAEVEEKFGVKPTQIVDLLALAGDTSDNIPGVPGIGFKTAAKLLKQFGSLDGILSNIQDISGEKVKENLKTYRDQALVSRELATLHFEVPVECGLEGLRYDGPDYKALEALLNEFEFRKLLKELLPQAQPAQALEEEGTDYRTITSLEGLRELVKEAGEDGFSVTLRMTEENVAGSLMGMAFGLGSKLARYVPVEGELTEEAVIKGAAVLLENGAIRKDTDNSKLLYMVSGRAGVHVRGVAVDTSIASYLLNPSRPDHVVEALGYDLLGISHEAVSKTTDPAEIAKSYCKKASIIKSIAVILEKQLEEEALLGLYNGMELPLSRVLSEMELEGIKVDREKLSDLSKEIAIELSTIERQIYAIAGMEFNINSPKQLAELLFEKLRLKPTKKTKTGYSTDEEVLNQLAASHEVPRLIINFRQLSKLKSTYVDALQELINPATGRIHTSFNQTVTATGRLSSSRPNLQNIPVRGEIAGRIRGAFIAEEGFTFLAGDYSQIELRIVAHMSEDPILMDAFKKGEDIHTRTASEVFGIMPALVTSEMRRRAKAINFGIIYGMGPYGLSVELGISMKEALEYINSYFDHYRLVKQFIDRTVSEATEQGSTRTLFGRRRFIPELRSPVESTVRLGARLAINTPIQGTAADMVKEAMVRISRRVQGERLKTRMLLQIHDELIFEVPHEESERAAALVKEEMEGVVDLKVPIVVNLKSGSDWNSVE